MSEPDSRQIPACSRYNSGVDNFLTIYSQSERSMGRTRGYGPKIYVETKLYYNLILRIFDPKTKLAIFASNAGAGKTVFIQHLEKIATDQKAVISKQTNNGCSFKLCDLSYQTLY